MPYTYGAEKKDSIISENENDLKKLLNTAFCEKFSEGDETETTVNGCEMDILPQQACSNVSPPSDGLVLPRSENNESKNLVIAHRTFADNAVKQFREKAYRTNGDVNGICYNNNFGYAVRPFTALVPISSVIPTFVPLKNMEQQGCLFRAKIKQ